MLLSSCLSLICNLFPFQYQAYARVEIQQKNKSNGQMQIWKLKLLMRSVIQYYDMIQQTVKWKYLSIYHNRLHIGI